VENRSHRKAGDALVLGTVQFGLPYGVANRQGQPDIGRVREILDLAYRSGLRVLDTAAAYGESETVLGACGTDHWSVITKVPSLDGVDDADIGPRARQSVLQSLDRLRIGALHAVLAHDRRDMVGERGRRMLEGLAPLKDDGLVGRIGVSVYRPKDLAGIDAECSQIVQAPFNVFDQSFVSFGEAAALRARGGELHVRSVFLQGLLLMAAQERPARFARWPQLFARYDEQVRDSGLDPAGFCLGFAAGQADVARCVVGVDTPQQLLQLVAAFDAGQNAAIEARDLMSDEPALIDPRTWKDEA
jgi:aryl-alcohol dehydrogenase-like predicted oxidoreductase